MSMNGINRFLQGQVLAHASIQMNEQLAHTGHDSDFEFFAMADQMLVVRMNHLVITDRRQSGHVERVANAAPPPENMPLTSVLTAITIKRRDSHQRSDLPTIEPSQFRKDSEQSQAQVRTH